MSSSLPDPTYVFFELCALAIAVVVLWHAFTENRTLLPALIAFYPATFLLEFFNIRYGHGYYYDEFIWMLGDSPSWVPACVVASWGSILYAAILTVRRLPLSAVGRPLVAGLLALMLDIAFDPVAATSKITGGAPGLCTGPFPPGPADGIGFWIWCVPSTEAPAWFGIPLSNFFGWWAAIAAYVAAIEISERAVAKVRQTLHPRVAEASGVVAIWLCAAGLFYGTMFIWEEATRVVGAWPLTLCVLAIPVLFLLRAAMRGVRSGPIPLVPLLPVLFTMPWTFAQYWITGEVGRSGLLLGIVIVACAIAAFFAYTLPYRLDFAEHRNPSSEDTR